MSHLCVRRIPALLALTFGGVACGAGEPGFDPPPVDAPFAAVAVGVLHTCGTTSTGRVYCWGWNRDGELGDGSRTDRRLPVRVVSDSGFASASGGGGHTCAVTAGGSPYCWGFNLSGQLGDGGAASAPTPIAVAGGLTLVAVEAGGAFTCGLAADSTAWCWGWGAYGQLGNGERADRSVPVAVGGGGGTLKFLAVSPGTRHACGLASDSTAWCWGGNGAGELGNGSAADTVLPAPVSGGRKFVAVSAGFDHTCALEASGDAYCWGANSLGQLGDTLVTNALVPNRVTGSIAFVSISAGAAHNCGLTATGAGYCWGSDASGQLGSQPAALCAAGAGTLLCTPVPARVTGGLIFRSISAGTQHSCGLTTDNVAYCWGLNDRGQLGDGSTRGSVTPVRVGKQFGS